MAGASALLVAPSARLLLPLAAPPALPTLRPATRGLVAAPEKRPSIAPLRRAHRVSRIRAARDDDEAGTAPPPPPAAPSPPSAPAQPSRASIAKLEAEAAARKGRVTAIVTGVVSVLLGVGYLLLVQLLDRRGVLLPPPPEAFDP